MDFAFLGRSRFAPSFVRRSTFQPQDISPLNAFYVSCSFS